MSSKKKSRRRTAKRRQKRNSVTKHQALEDRKLLAADFFGGAVHGPIHLPASSQVQQVRTGGHIQSNQRVAAMRAAQAQFDLDENRRRSEDRNHDPTDHHETSDPDETNDVLEIESRAIDGTGNNLTDADLGSTHTQLLRASEAQYADGISTPSGEDRVSAREISNELAAQTTTEANDRSLTDIAWLFGQFIDHDIDLTESADPAESFAIEVPEGDAFFDPFATGEAEISLTRSAFDTSTGTSTDDPREQINEITSFLDGSVIYGSDQERADALRSFEGGLLLTSEGDLLPFNEDGLDNAGGTDASLFLAGDVRANENVALSAMHTIWVREHNFQAQLLAAEDPTLTDEQLYQAAKTIVTAELQAITYNEFLPALLGEDTVDDYSGYDDTVDPGINNVFSTAAYRFGHTMLSSELLRLNDDGTTADEGNIALQSAFFSPGEITDNGVESILLGATVQLANEVDNQVVDDVRNFLFGAPGSGGFDLVSLNIQRGRDHGLADYNQVRADFGLERVESFSEISSDPEVAAKLEQLYGDVDNIDVWVGGLAEDHVEGSSLGELFSAVIVDQFERIRDGDRLWYQNVFSGDQLDSIESTSLADIIERNSDITGLQDNVFFDAEAQPESEIESEPEKETDKKQKSDRNRSFASGLDTRHDSNRQRFERVNSNAANLFDRAFVDLFGDDDSNESKRRSSRGHRG